VWQTATRLLVRITVPQHVRQRDHPISAAAERTITQEYSTRVGVMNRRSTNRRGRPSSIQPAERKAGYPFGRGPVLAEHQERGLYKRAVESILTSTRAGR
jgi:hypothetical protein